MNKKVMFVCLSVSILLMCPLITFAGTLFRLPLAYNTGYSAWFDHNSLSGVKLRYDCATNFPYDNHLGTDFAASMGSYVYSGAAGTIYLSIANCPDGIDPNCGYGYGNQVRLEHGDGLVTIYAHMKQWTPICCQSVLCGAYLGQTGNSGYSTGPHLHFELRLDRSTSYRRDFFGGACNSPSYWVNQNGGWPTTQCQ